MIKAISKLIFNPIKKAVKQGLIIGRDCKLESTNFGTEPWLIKIGNHVEIANNVQFLTHDGATWVIRNQEKYREVIKYGKIIIHDNVFIGFGSIILPGVQIGSNSIVGAGSVVTKSVPSGKIVAGNPAKVIGDVEEYAEKSLMATPNYDKENYKKNKAQEVLRVLEGRNK